jgi:putative peptidoglycan lipid II flippase
LAGALLGRPLMELLTSGVDDPGLRADKAELGARMLVVFMPQVVLYGVGIVLTGVLQSHRRFVAPALAPLLSSTVVIGAYLLYAGAGSARSIGQLSRSQELVLSVGTTLGVAALTLPLLVPLARLRLGLRPTLRMPAGVAGALRGLALAGGVALGAQQLAALVVLWLAQPVAGATVVFQLAWTVFLVPWAFAPYPYQHVPGADRGGGRRWPRGATPRRTRRRAAGAAGVLPAGRSVLRRARASACAAAGAGAGRPRRDGPRSSGRPSSLFVAGGRRLRCPGHAVQALTQPTRPSPARATAVGFAIAVALERSALDRAACPRLALGRVGCRQHVGMNFAAALLVLAVRGRPVRPATTPRGQDPAGRRPRRVVSAAAGVRGGARLDRSGLPAAVAGVAADAGVAFSVVRGGWVLAPSNRPPRHGRAPATAAAAMADLAGSSAVRLVLGTSEGASAGTCTTLAAALVSAAPIVLCVRPGGDRRDAVGFSRARLVRFEPVRHPHGVDPVASRRPCAPCDLLAARHTCTRTV